MSFDIVVLGATGYTGKLVVEVLAKGRDNVTWCIAGRSQEKIRELVDSLKTKGVDISNVPTQLVDVNNKESIKGALQHAKLVLNCVGPNTTMSEPIVDICIRTRTHYVDMSAEINHILKLYLKYHKAAEEANVLIVPSCGFASIATASGVLYLKDQFQGTLNTVECYTELGVPLRAYIPFVETLVSYGTWASLVHVMRNMKEYQQIKQENFPALELPKEIKRNFFHCRRKKLWYPYPGPDESVIEMSEHYLREKKKKRPVHFKMYTTMPLLIHYLIIPVMFIYYYLTYFDWFAKLLLRYPRFFTLGYMSHKGPSEKARKETKVSFTYVGRGWDRSTDDFSKPPNKKEQVKLSLNDPYRLTGVLMVIAGITILKEQSVMPSGGVVNVGAAFYDTSLVEKCKNNGIEYENLPNT